MASGSDSENDSQRSLSPTAQGPAPTPGYGLDRSRSNSPDFENKSQTSARSGSRTPSANGSRSRSPSAGSQRSNSAVSERSNRSSRKSRSPSVASNKSRSSNGSHNSNRSRSGSSRSSRSSNRSRSGSRESNKSRSSNQSKSPSHASNRSRSRSKESNRSRDSSKGSARSRSGSSRSRSASAESNKSHDSNRSKSAESKRSRSKSRGSGSDRSRSPSVNQQTVSQHNSRSNTPNLEINAESPGSDIGVKRKRGTSDEDETKKKHRTITSDSENEDKEEPSAAALFGDADDISSEEEKEDKEERLPERRGSDEDSRDRLSDTEQNEQRPTIDDDEEKELEPEPVPETRIDVGFPKISCDLGRDIHFVKLPNFLSVETRPFDQETYEDEIDEEETLDEEGRARLKLKVENTIRWREDIDKEGNTFKESNARFVRWSDGSLSLHLGSEIFDVYKQPLQGDHNHLFIRQGTGLQGQAVFRTKLSFRPHSTESFTHRKMTLSLADRSQKVSGIKILSQVGVDPDQDRKTLLKKEEEKLRQTVRVTKTRKRGEGGTRSHQRETFREEEGSDEDGAISLNAIKNKYKSGAAAQTRGGGIYSSDEEGSDFEARRARKLDKTKALKDSDTSDSE
ncbi:hypothetical protein FQR65_LT06007 [Abscondita terminalis]|nr:hypothetical protein FQR65_LT06007 [Abscondita terminalis]